jgi:hypothetical protein
MNLQEGQSNPPNTVAIKTPDLTPNAELRLISLQDLKNFTYTGINIQIPVPLVKVSSEALFAINIDGFIPNLRGRTCNQLFRNLFPVQPVVYSHTLSGLKISWEAVSLPQLMPFFSYRYVSGDVSIGLRIISNTAQSGNLLVSQVSGVSRYYYGKDETYTGLRFLQDSMSPIDYAMNGFTEIDLSLNRNVGIVPCRRDNTVRTDFAKKLYEVGRVENDKTSKFYPVSNQFLEDWLIIGALTDIPHPEASSITIAVHMDWSRVQFHVPMLCVPSLNTDSINLQILQFLESFVGKEHFDDLVLWKWWPRDLAESKALMTMKHYATFSAPLKFENVSASLVGTIQNIRKKKSTVNTG